jgi:hypothetical protein
MLNEQERDGLKGYLQHHNYNYNQGVFMDEKNKRFVDMNLMDQISHINYKSTFKNVGIKFFILFNYSIDQIFTDIKQMNMIKYILKKEFIYLVICMN